jgi:phospholipase C
MAKRRSTPDRNRRRISRRDVLKAGAGLIALGGIERIPGVPALLHPRSAWAQPRGGGLPPPDASGIEHVVVVMMENRSFDHFLGWAPGTNGKQGNSYPNRIGVRQSTYHLTEYQGCAHPDPDHSYEGGLTEYDGGKCDGWLRAGTNDDFAIGYYTATDLDFFRQVLPYFTVCDNYFSAILAETFPNRFYQHAAQTDRLHNMGIQSTTLSPTIWDRIAASGLTGAYYFNDEPFLGLWGAQYIPISRAYSQFLVDAASGTLPNLAFVDPAFGGEDQGVSRDDHPHADIRDGQAFLNEVYTAVRSSPQWSSTVLVINYDEWGGFFDHVAPTTVADFGPVVAVPPSGASGVCLRGFRVPCLVISPWSAAASVAHPLFDHTSVLRMIEWRWGLEPLTTRDANANNLAMALDFTRASASPNPPATFDVPPGLFGKCVTEGSGSGVVVSTSTADDWSALHDLAVAAGWPI